MGVLFVMGSPYSSSTVTFLRRHRDDCTNSITANAEPHIMLYTTQIEEEGSVNREEG